jgi:tRNA G37 N-methylase Trm5
LSNERKEIAEILMKRKKKEILVFFGGVAPYAIIIAKNNPSACVVSVELNREASKYARLNMQLNKAKNVEIVQGDVKRVISRFVHAGKKFDAIIMPRPKLKESFLRYAFKVAKKDTLIIYYDFCDANKIGEIVEKIREESRKYRKKIKILKVKRAGEIGPYQYRVRIDFDVI